MHRSHISMHLCACAWCLYEQYLVSVDNSWMEVYSAYSADNREVLHGNSPMGIWKSHSAPEVRACERQGTWTGREP